MSQTNARLQGGGVVLPRGSSPGNINVGESALIIDSDGSVKTQDSAGTKTAISGGAATLETALLSFAQSNYSTINRYLKTEFESSGLDYATSSIGPNGGSNTQTQAVKGGATVLATSAAGSGGITARRAVPATPTPITQNAKTDVPWFIAGILSFPTTVDANSQIALAMESIAFSQAITLGINGAASTSFYSLSIQGIDNAVSTVAVDLTGALVLMMLGFDGTTLKGWTSSPNGIMTVAPTLLMSQTVLTNVPTLQSCAMLSLFQGSAVASKSVKAEYLFEAWQGAV